MKDLGGWSAHPRAAHPARQTADLPPGYPQEYRRLVTLRDGRSVLIRPVLPSDAPALAESIKSTDADTIRRRFLGRHLHVTPELVAYLTTVDYTSRFALVAVEPASQRGVAIARYEPAERAGAAPPWPANCSACSPRPPANGAYTPSQACTSPTTARSRP